MTSAQVVRETIARARRTVVKIGSSSLTSESGGIDRNAVTALCDAVASRHQAGHEIIVVSSGAIAAALDPMKLDKRPKDLATQQAAAGVGQSLLMAEYNAAFARYEIIPGQVLLSVNDLIRRAHYRNAQRAIDKMLQLGFVPIVNENDAVATDEIRFGDNDRLAALVAHLSHAEALVLLSDIDALYTLPPDNPAATRVEYISHPQQLKEYGISGTASGVGTGGMHTKVHAATMAADSGIPSIVTRAALLSQVFRAENIGTCFAVTHKRRQTRLLWLAHLANIQGTITIDHGAEMALARRGTSLLAVGVTGISGEFEPGDPVEVRGEAGNLIARGMVNFSSEELPAMLGLNSAALGARLGMENRKEIIHRNDLVVTGEAFKGSTYV